VKDPNVLTATLSGALLVLAVLLLIRSDAEMERVVPASRQRAERIEERQQRPPAAPSVISAAPEIPVLEDIPPLPVSGASSPMVHEEQSLGKAVPIQPPPLDLILAHWTLTGIGSNSVVIQDEAVPRSFLMKLGGEPQEVPYPGWSFSVVLKSTDTEKYTATFRSNKHEEPHQIKLVGIP